MLSMVYMQNVWNSEFIDSYILKNMTSVSNPTFLIPCVQ